MSQNDGSDDQRRKQAAELFASEETPLVRFIRRRVRNPEDAKEIAQEVRVRYLQALQSGAVIQDEVKYLFGIANKVIRDSWRKKESAQKVFASGGPDDLVLEVPDSRADPEKEEESRRMQELLRAAVRSLDPTQRAMILLKYTEGLSVEESARRCGLSKHQANRVLLEARQLIREFFKHQGEVDQ